MARSARSVAGGLHSMPKPLTSGTVAPAATNRAAAAGETTPALTAGTTGRSASATVGTVPMDAYFFTIVPGAGGTTRCATTGACTPACTCAACRVSFCTIGVGGCQFCKFGA